MEGIFELELSLKPLMQLFEGQLQWAELLAKSSGISFVIVDETVSTDAGVRGCVDRMLSDSISTFSPEGLSYLTYVPFLILNTYRVRGAV